MHSFEALGCPCPTLRRRSAQECETRPSHMAVETLLPISDTAPLRNRVRPWPWVGFWADERRGARSHTCPGVFPRFADRLDTSRQFPGRESVNSRQPATLPPFIRPLRNRLGIRTWQLRKGNSEPLGASLRILVKVPAPEGPHLLYPAREPAGSPGPVDFWPLGF